MLFDKLCHILWKLFQFRDIQESVLVNPADIFLIVTNGSRKQDALSVVKPGGKVFTGGILATLRPEWIAKEFPTVINNTGLLNHEGTLGLKGEECIDTLPLDYGILDDIKDEYKYPAEDAYFTYMTRGCGRLI